MLNNEFLLLNFKICVFSLKKYASEFNKIKKSLFNIYNIYLVYRNFKLFKKKLFLEYFCFNFK